MADVSFAHVPAEGFAAFGAQLEKDVWGTIEITPYLGADGRPDKPTGDAPTFVSLKLQLQLTVTELVQVMQSTAGARGFDAVWDQAQKQFSACVVAARKSTNASTRAAADRLFSTLLLGRGDGQTLLGYQQEVDFGRNQARLSKESVIAAAIASLGLGPMIQAIDVATEDLAAAIGRGRADLAPAQQRKALVMKCNQVFRTVYRMLDYHVEYGTPGADREKAAALQAVLADLAMKYPVRPGKTKATPIATANP